VWSARAPAQPQDPKPPTLLQKLNQAGVIAAEQKFVALYKQEKYAEALPILQRALASRVQVQGERNLDVATSYGYLGLTLYELRDYAAAEKSHAKALSIRRELQGDQHADVATAFYNMAAAQQEQGKHAAARKAFEQALAIRREKLGAKHLDTLLTLSELAGTLSQLSEFAAAREMYENLLAARREVLGDQDPAVATTWNDLGVLLHRMDDPDGARKCYEQTAAIYRAKFGDRHPPLGLTWRNLAYVCHDAGDDLAARQYALSAIALHRAAFGDAHPNLAGDYELLGTISESLGDRPFAWQCYTFAHGVYRKALGDKHPKVASSLESMCDIRLWYGDLDEALKYAHEAVAIYREVEGPQTIRGLATLASVLRARGDYPKAREYFEQIRDERVRTLGAEHDLTLHSIENLAGVYQMEGNAAKAIPLFEQALAGFRRKYGLEHDSTTNTLNNLATAQVSSAQASGEKWTAAADNYHQLRRLVRRRADLVLANLSEAEQIAYLSQNYQRRFHTALSIALAAPRENQSIREHTALWAINGKGVSLDALATQQRMSHADTPERQALYDQLRLARRRLLGVAITGTDTERAAAERARQELVQNEQRLAREVAQQLGLPAPEDPWVELAAVRKALPADGVLIEIVNVEIFRFNAGPKESRWAPARLIAWVVPPQGEIQVVDLGVTQETVDRVQALQLEIKQSAERILEEGEADAEKILREKLEAVASKVLRPLEAVADKYTQWHIGNDGATWLIPWAALPAKSGKYLIEERTVQLLISGRDLLAPSDMKAAAGGVIIADPDFSLDLAQAAPAAGQQQARRSRDMKDTEWARLPFTLVEAKAAVPILTTYLKQAPQVITGAAATEAAIKQAARPRIALFSTHGFFLSFSDAATSAPAPKAPDSNTTAAKTQTEAAKPPENPLLRCGLILAGANRPPSKGAAARDDGVLTGLEIVGTDFRGTELVVLSACETGLGDARDGEGVAGLRQAFQLAGAQSVMATLWRVPDAETSWLITRFWENLAKGESRSAALRSAQTAVIAKRRAADQCAHPYFWAAFTLTGRP